MSPSVWLKGCSGVPSMGMGGLEWFGGCPQGASMSYGCQPRRGASFPVRTWRVGGGRRGATGFGVLRSGFIPLPLPRRLQPRAPSTGGPDAGRPLPRAPRRWRPLPPPQRHPHQRHLQHPPGEHPAAPARRVPVAEPWRGGGEPFSSPLSIPTPVRAVAGGGRGGVGAAGRGAGAAAGPPAAGGGGGAGGGRGRAVPAGRGAGLGRGRRDGAAGAGAGAGQLPAQGALRRQPRRPHR